jgi:PEP-CTERM motif
MTRKTLKYISTTKLSAIAACALLLLGAHGVARAADAPAGSWSLAGADVFGFPDGVYRTQGITTDGTNVYFSWQFGLEKTDLNYNEISKNSTYAITSSGISLPQSGIPASLSSLGYDHIGDIDYANGLIYASLDDSQTTPHYDQPAIAVFDASTLAYTGTVYTLNPPDGHVDVASWVAVDAKDNLAYGMAYNSATEMAVYNLTDFSFVKYVQLSSPLDQVQGGKIFGDWMYMSSNDDSRSVYRVNLLDGTVEDLFSVKQPYDQEVEGLSVTADANGNPLVSVLVTNNPLDSSNPLDENVTLYHYDMVAAVPEPASYALMLGGLGLMGFTAKRRRR